MHDAHYLEDLRTRFNSGEALDYLFFWGHQRSKKGITASCFSQWYNAEFIVEGQRYPTAEHFMMAQKAALFGDQEVRAQVLLAPTPNVAKALGRNVRGFNDELWLQHRYAIVVQANQAKFSQNPELNAFLKETGSRIIVEASPVDSIWGIGLAQDDENANNPNQWRGLNLLGFALMQVRDET
ncbi:NADAR family protein [Pseudomonas gingeri]|uniref:NADAR family protein n=1 Tax=Pseudomonas gingeri TaxID=117681 RepID=A0A7Y7XJ39_9PSED|nr:NADAR family protein [Pseudomonas gingeri]NWC00542.1 NADAR family protein [Pseudomonas gingeri]